MSTTITDQLSAAIAARKDSLKALRGRIGEVLEPIPIGVKLVDDPARIDGGLVCQIVRLCTGASQWSNRTWEQTIKGYGAITADGTLLYEALDGSVWDGNNMHHRTTEGTYRWPDSDEQGLTWASGKTTRELAARLPAAIARYMAECEAERAANDATHLARDMQQKLNKLYELDISISECKLMLIELVTEENIMKNNTAADKEAVGILRTLMMQKSEASDVLYNASVYLQDRERYEGRRRSWEMRRAAEEYHADMRPAKPVEARFEPEAEA
jgi:hypothetical protein